LLKYHRYNKILIIPKRKAKKKILVRRINRTVSSFSSRILYYQFMYWWKLEFLIKILGFWKCITWDMFITKDEYLAFDECLLLDMNIWRIENWHNSNALYICIFWYVLSVYLVGDVGWLPYLIPLHPTGDIGQPQFLSTSSCLGLSSLPLPMLYLWPAALR